MRKLTFDIEDRMKSIGWYQMIGGIYGILSVFYILIRAGTLTGGDLFLVLFTISLFSFGVYCGNLLRKTDVRGLNLSTWNQALQVIQFGVLAITFEFNAGIGVLFGFDWGETFIPDVSISFSGFNFQYHTTDTSHLSFWINIVPILIIYWIDRIEKDIEAQKKIVEYTIKAAKELTESEENKHNA